MKPVLALVGRPNVGKSTLFNRVTRSRDALVADMPGLTRDRKFGDGQIGKRDYIVVDTGGLSGQEEGIDDLMASQSWQAVEQADHILFLVDARDGLTPEDENIARRLRATGKPVHLVVNKIDGVDADVVCAEFHALGLGEVYPISAAHGRGVRSMMDAILDTLPESVEEPGEEEARGIRVAIVGRPNVGKSTLVNRILGEERVVTYDLPGTTRDSIYIPFERDGVDYTLIDTAGVRRRAKVREAVEKFSVIKTLQAIDDANVVVMVLDARQGVGEQDATLLGYVLEKGRALVIAVNKWDGLERDQRERIRHELELKIPFADFAKTHFVSALHGTGVGELFESIQTAYRCAMAQFDTPRLTRLLEDLVSAHPPPLSRGRRIKLRYAHQGGRNPPRIVIHGNQTERLPDSYRRYLVNGFRKHLHLRGTPVRIELRTGENPYKGRRNKLTKRQQEKRERLKRFVKRRK
ncbi:MAG TPA: ribosome biogenesis GTPase Der [Gammaproteobacteria bacterium]|nr:ribosome biogenesis GTPase Der [Gammaproteobacteria bacterium]